MKNKILNSMMGLLLLSAGVAQDKTPKTEPKTEKKPAEEAKSVPSADEILSKYLQAIGGKEMVERLRSQMAQASFESGEGSQKAEWIRKAPNRWLFTIFDGSGKPSFQQGSNGRQRWTKSSNGLQKEDPNETESRLMKLDRAANFKSLFPKIELKGREKVGAAEGFVLEATPAHGSAHRLTFDVKTGLLIRESYSINGGEPDHEMEYDDYKEVDGIRVPFTLRCSGGDNWTVRLKEVKNNAPIDDAKFDPPSE